MDSWVAIVALIFALAALAAWALTRQRQAAVEDFGESRTIPARLVAGESGRVTPADLTRLLLEEASRQTGVSLSEDPMAMTRLREAAKKAIEDLRDARVAEINLPYLAADGRGPKHFATRVERDSMGRLTLR